MRLDNAYPSVGDEVFAVTVDCPNPEGFIGKLGAVVDYGADGAPKVKFDDENVLFCPLVLRLIKEPRFQAVNRDGRKVWFRKTSKFHFGIHVSSILKSHDNEEWSCMEMFLLTDSELRAIADCLEDSEGAQ